MEQPAPIQTERLILRPFTLDDAPAVTTQVSEREIADTTLAIPHPYEEEMAREWISTHEPALKQDKEVTLAITLAGTGELIGAIGFRLNLKHTHGEMGYWIGKPHWNKGYGTEAARAMLEFGFITVGLNRIFAHCLSRNPASARILQKIGMKPEGRLRQHVKKWDVHEDIDQFGILRGEYETKRKERS